MGNICSRSSNKPDSFAQPGRPLGSSPAAPESHPASAPRAPRPAKSAFGSQGRTLGDAPPTDAGDVSDPRANAAIAAQKRAEASNTPAKGKLGNQLAAQKAQTQTQTLNEASRGERAARDADNAAAARTWN